MSSLLSPRVHRKARWAEIGNFLLCSGISVFMILHIRNVFKTAVPAAHGPGMVFDLALTALTTYGAIYCLVKIRLDIQRQKVLR